MLNLRDYTWNVFEINHNNPEAADLGVAFDMLRNNIRLGRAEDGGTVVAWNLLKERWDAMTTEEQAQSRKDYHATAKAPGLWDAFKAGDKPKFDQIIKDYAAKLAAEAEAEAEAQEQTEE